LVAFVFIFVVFRIIMVDCWNNHNYIMIFLCTTRDWILFPSFA
jgi:hypothetical protein